MASLQSRRLSKALLSLLLVGSRRGLVCLHSQVYIFVRCGLCRASFYSVPSPARCLLMHTFLSLAASKAADKTSSSLISERSSLRPSLILIPFPWSALTVLHVRQSACLLFYTASPLMPPWSSNLCAPLQVTHPDFVTFRRQAGTGPSVKSLVFSPWHFKVHMLYVTNKHYAQNIPKAVQGHIVELCGISALPAHVTLLPLWC